MGEGQNVPLLWPFDPARSGQGGGILRKVLLQRTLQAFLQIRKKIAEDIPIYFNIWLYRIPVGKSIPPGLENIVAAVLPVVVSVAWQAAAAVVGVLLVQEQLTRAERLGLEGEPGRRGGPPGRGQHQPRRDHLTQQKRMLYKHRADGMVIILESWPAPPGVI
jgi:hypothetical protein